MCGTTSLRQLERAEDVDVEDLAPVVQVGLLDQRHEVAHEGVVDQHVDAAELGARRVDEPPAVVGVGDVGRHATARRPSARTSAAPVSSSIAARRAPRARRRRPRARTATARSRPHAGADAGDDGDAVVEQHGQRSPRLGGAMRHRRRAPKASIWSTSSSHERLRKRTPQWLTPSACSSRSDAAMLLGRAACACSGPTSNDGRADVEPRRCSCRSRSARRRARARRCSRMEAICAGMPISGTSPAAASRRRARRRGAAPPACEPPTQIGGRGCCTGRGRRPTSRTVQMRPVVLRVLVAERGGDDVDRLVEQRAAAREVDAEGGELALRDGPRRRRG